MSGEQRKHAKSSASTERTAGQHDEEKHDKQTGQGNKIGTTMQAPLVRFDMPMRPPTKSQVSNELLRK